MNIGSSVETLDTHLGVGRPYCAVNGPASSHLLHSLLKLSELVLDEAL